MLVTVNFKAERIVAQFEAVLYAPVEQFGVQSIDYRCNCKYIKIHNKLRFPICI